MYKELIKDALIDRQPDISDADLTEVEDWMRNVIFNSTLSWQTRRQLTTAARTAWNDILYMRTPEGKAYINQLTAGLEI